jgi:hypothetical protein
MTDRAERREEIKLLLEYVKLGLSLAGVAAVIVAIVQWRLANQVAGETVYQRMTTEWRDHLKSFVDKPVLRPYFEEGKQFASDDSNKQGVFSTSGCALRCCGCNPHLCRFTGIER